MSGPVLIKFNEALAKNLSLDLDPKDTNRLAAIFAGNVLPPGAEPLAMAYAGHQFGNFVPQLVMVAPSCWARWWMWKACAAISS